jgi:uncharacterized protein involved in exopolysaccharide biosynthesis
LSAQLEDARVKEMRDTPTVSVLDPPAVPEKHRGPRKALFALVAALLGLFGASGVVMRRGEAPPRA